MPFTVIAGQTLRFTYDEGGRVASVTVNGITPGYGWRALVYPVGGAPLAPGNGNPDVWTRECTHGPSEAPLGASGNGDTDFRKRGTERFQVRPADHGRQVP